MSGTIMTIFVTLPYSDVGHNYDNICNITSHIFCYLVDNLGIKFYFPNNMYIKSIKMPDEVFTNRSKEYHSIAVLHLF